MTFLQVATVNSITDALEWRVPEELCWHPISTTRAAGLVMAYPGAIATGLTIEGAQLQYVYMDALWSLTLPGREEPLAYKDVQSLLLVIARKALQLTASGNERLAKVIVPRLLHPCELTVEQIVEWASAAKDGDKLDEPWRVRVRKEGGKLEVRETFGDAQPRWCDIDSRQLTAAVCETMAEAIATTWD